MNVSRVLVFIQQLFLVSVLVVLATDGYAQKRVRLKNADVLRFGKKNEQNFQRLIGNVVFTQNETTIYCDSAHYYRKENSVEAFGNVKIIEGDSITITGSRLVYNGDDKTAQLRRNVVFKKLKTATLYTN